MIHPTAIVHPNALVATDVKIGPYSIIDEHVEVASGCVVGPHVHITGRTTIGSDNRFHAGCVIGDAPQDFKYDGAPTWLRIGDANTFREHVTVHRSNREDEDTVIGSHNLFMAHSHVGHNCRLHDHIILANGALLGGHVEVFDRVFISGNCLAHQFVRIGTLALMQGGAALSQDLPPYCIASGANGICGLNIIGLRRAGFSTDDRTELKRLYQRLFRSGVNLSAAVSAAESAQHGTAATVLIDFIRSSRRGVCRHRAD